MNEKDSHFTYTGHAFLICLRALHAMIVCLCHRVSDRDIHRVVGEGVTNFELLQDLTKVASNCGNCLDCAQMIFEEACAARGCGQQHVHAAGIVPIATATP